MVYCGNYQSFPARRVFVFEKVFSENQLRNLYSNICFVDLYLRDQYGIVPRGIYSYLMQENNRCEIYATGRALARRWVVEKKNSFPRICLPFIVYFRVKYNFINKRDSFENLGSLLRSTDSY